MKLRKHQGNKSYKITWFQRPPNAGELCPQLPVYTIGQNPTATLDAFLFGRDRTNIIADIRRFHSEYGPSQVQKKCFLGAIV